MESQSEAGPRLRVIRGPAVEIVREARRQLATAGAQEVTAESVAGALDVDPVLVARYVPSQEALLTAMIRDASAELGEAVRAAEEKVDRVDFLGRWLALAVAHRAWSTAHPQDHTLLFASPVPGYRSPLEGIDPAAAVPLLLMELVQDAADAGRTMPVAQLPTSRSVQNDLKSFRTLMGTGLDDAHLTRAVMAWVQLIGCISFELLGIAGIAIHDVGAHFEYQMRVVGGDLGLT